MSFNQISAADSITVESNAATMAAALVQGAPDTAQAAILDAGNTSGLTFSAVDVGAFGTFTPVPPGAPIGTSVVNIAPGDGESGFFAVTFTLPNTFSSIQLSGAANVDDIGRAFLNGNPISPDPLLGVPNTISEFGNATFSTADNAYFQAGLNTLLIADDNSGGGPSGTAFYATITFNTAAAPEPSILLLIAGGFLGLGVTRNRNRLT